jgi:hypothetical protein
LQAVENANGFRHIWVAVPVTQEAMMKSTLTAILAGAIALAALAAVAPAFAGDGQPHVLSVRMPDGSVSQISYYGDVPPRVVFKPSPVGVATPPLDGPVGFGSPFATLQRMAAMMDRQAEMMMRQALAMQQAAMSGPLSRIPAGALGSTLPTVGGGSFCVRSVQITYHGDGAPRVVSHSAGSCGPTQGEDAAAPVTAPAPVVPAPQSRQRAIEVKAGSDWPIMAMAQPAVPDRQ